MIAVKVRTYRGAHICILNEDKMFLSVVFDKGRFYHWMAIAEGITSDSKFLEAAENALVSAHLMVDKIRERSLFGRLKNKLYAKISKRFQGAQELSRNEDQSPSGSELKRFESKKGEGAQQGESVASRPEAIELSRVNG